ncbi:MAG: hypothetical protein CEE38_07550 [Planctomycetes bacterium B3_Pla]|nr:MAG: hypothetical protein CEE38_07550 [Planctomycetes bacterium B3_Pla]
MKRTLICITIVLSAVAPVEARTVELTLYPAKIAEYPQEYLLLPGAGKLTDADAVPLYEKAIQSMPKDLEQEQIQEWLKLPIEQFPQKKAEAAIQKYVESLRLVARAARCKECNWPEPTPGKLPGNLAEYRRLAFILELWARLEISRGQYKGALAAMQTGFGMARHIGQGPASIQAMVGTAIGALMCKEVEQFIQRKDSPNLYRALANLPRPLVDMEGAIENELANLKNYNVLVRKQFEKQLKPSHDRVRMIQRRANTRLNALQCLEAIRDYAAAHDGQLPETLSDIVNLDVPKDLLAGKAFEYSRNAAGAVLQSAVPKDGRPKDAVRYEIILKK